MPLDYTGTSVPVSSDHAAETLSVLTLLLIGWLICGLAAALVMRNKARSGCGGFAIGFLLRPLGLILALVTAPDHREAERRSLVSGEMRRCPHCAELIRRAALKCRYCGSSVSPLEPEDSEGPPQFGDRPEGVSEAEWEEHIEAIRDSYLGRNTN